MNHGKMIIATIVTIVAKVTIIMNYLFFWNVEILLLALYGCQTWPLTLRDEHRLGVSENSVLRRIFGLKRDEAIGDWRKLHSEELHNLHTPTNIIRVIKSRRMR
jgi:hypothetical protein